MDFNSSVFAQTPKVTVPDDVKVIFVSDMFTEDYVGGAELTTQALIDASPYKVFRLHSRDVTPQLLEQNVQKFWIFGNYTQLNPQLIKPIISNMRYGIVEYDYKFCRYRSPEKHATHEGRPCDCVKSGQGQVVSNFMKGALNLWWMSQKQMEIYHDNFPDLKGDKNEVISSVFNKKHLDRMQNLAHAHRKMKRKGWIVLGSDSWIKGADAAKEWCHKNGKECEVVWNLPYDKVLEKLATAEGFVYLPQGNDTCPRMVIEAKLLDCKLELNEHVQHASEKWFASGTPESITDYLLNSPGRFWNGVKRTVEHKTTISGYTQTYNCIKQDYPWMESIKSLLGFCDEVVVVDGGSTDGTYDVLCEWAKDEPKLKPFQHVRDWNDKRFALFNGQQKAVARKRCTMEFCWQVDIDEVVHEQDYEKVRMMASTFPREIDILALPVIEYWGGPEKVRVDINPWKWRLTRNNPRITHGVPEDHRRYDDDGTMYSAGSDGDDYIYEDTHERVPFGTFYTPQIEQARQAAMMGNPQAQHAYGQWLNAVAANVPGVHHYSWYDLERKVYTYKNFWSKHWASLYNKVQDDTAENNMFFDKPWSQVTDDEIKAIAERMKREMGGWVFHNRIDFSKPTPWVTLAKTQPAIMKDWLEKRGK